MTIDLFPFDLPAAVHPCAAPRVASAVLTTHEQTGYDLGWDHAHHGVAPPAPYAHEPSPLQIGWQAGAAVFGTRTLAATPAVRQWLHLRLHAWLRGRHVELFQITPAYLRRLVVSHCPITRELLDTPADDARRASFDRVRHDAGYAAVHLVMMSARANRAKGAHHADSAMDIAQHLDAESVRPNTAAPLHDGLNAAQWARIAVLCSYVDALPHGRAAALPMRVLPPNRLRLFNPVQALQAFVSQQVMRPGWSQRINAFEALLPSLGTRRAFRSFFQTLLPRVLAAGRPADAQRARWAVEDAWSHAPVVQRWLRFALRLDAVQCEALLTRAVVAGLVPAGVRIEPVADVQATDGWCLESKGYVPHGWSPPTPRRRSAPEGQTLH